MPVARSCAFLQGLLEQGFGRLCIAAVGRVVAEKIQRLRDQSLTVDLTRDVERLVQGLLGFRVAARLAERMAIAAEDFAEPEAAVVKLTKPCQRIFL